MLLRKKLTVQKPRIFQKFGRYIDPNMYAAPSDFGATPFTQDEALL